MPLRERFADWDEQNGTMEAIETGADRVAWGFRADGAMILLDDAGWFLIRNVGAGATPDEGRVTETLYVLEGPDGAQETAYIEPIWVASYAESFGAV